MNIKQAEARMREYAEANGIDFDELCENAGKHFEGDTPPKPRQEPLTEEELAALAEDDRQAFPRAAR